MLCPKCQQPIKKLDAIACPYCRTELKAHGHAGIPLHRATGNEPLCRTCEYHADDTCNYPLRPDAWECTMYRNRLVATVSTPTKYESSPSPQVWLRRNGIWVVVVGLVILSFFLASSKR